MAAVNLSQQWDYPALPLGPVAVERPHGVIGLGSTVSAPFILAPIPSVPAIGNWTPDLATEIAATTPVGFDATDAHGFRRIVVYAATSDGGGEMVYDGAAFVAPYTGSSTAAIANGLRFSIVRNGGWLASPRLTVIAVNVDGVEVTTAPPVVGNWIPGAGTQITTATPIGFDVTDAKGIASVHVYSGAETVYDGAAFTANYNAASTQTAIADGFRFSVIRNGGWLSAPQITVAAVNLDGIEA